MSDDERWLVIDYNLEKIAFEADAWFTEYKPALAEYAARKAGNGFETYLLHVSRMKPKEMQRHA